MRSKLGAFLLALSMAAAASGETATPVQTARFSNYSVDHGLSQSSVTALMQDQQGYLWIGTEDGLNRFDGYEFLRFGLASMGRSGLADGGIVGLRQGDDARIWIGTFTSGMYSLDPVSGFVTQCGSETPVPQDLAGRIRSLSIDDAGTVWVVGATAMFRQTVDCTSEEIVVADSSQGFRPLATSRSADGTMWVWTQDGALWKGDATGASLHFIRTFADMELRSPLIRAVAGSASDIWVALDSSDLFRLDGQGRILERFDIPAAAPFDARIRAIHQTPDGDTWVAGLGIGLVRVRSGTGVIATWHHDSADPASLAHNDTTSLLADRSGGLWVGTRSHGLSRLQINPEGIAHYRHSANNSSSIANNMVTVFAERRQDERIWVGTDGGGVDLLDFGVGVVTHYSHDQADSDSLSSDRVWALHEDRTGRLWIGTWFGELNVRQPGATSFDRFPSDEDSGNSATSVVLSIAESADGTLWFGTMSYGLFSLPPGSDRFSQTIAGKNSKSLTSNKISALFVDSHDTLWVGTWDAGINRVDPDTAEVKNFRRLADGGLPHETVRAITETADGAIWVGTPSGLARIDPASSAITSFSVESGLPPGTIYGIVADDDVLWVSSNRGLARFDPATRTAQQFGPADGLQGFEFNGGAALKTRDGRVLFGGTQGFNAFYPRQVRNNPYAPQVAITHVTVQDREFEPPGQAGRLTESSVEFAYDQNRISFEFAGLHYTSPQRIRYSYRLQGLQDEWLDTSASRRIATYANLAPGTYRFQVRAANNDGLWSEQDAAFSFVVAAPWWFTGPAYIAYILLSLLAVFGLVQWRTMFLRRRAALLAEKVREGTRQIAEQKLTIEKQAGNLQAMLATKERLFARVSHEFRTPLTLILGPLDSLLSRAQGKDAETLSLMQRNARRLLRLVEQLLDLSRLSGERPLQIETISLRPLVTALVGAFDSLAEQKQIDLSLTAPANPVVDANGEVLEAACSNLISNALKFTPAGGKVRVSLEVSSDTAVLKVCDSGPGIAPGMEEKIFVPFERGDSDMPGSGIGLAVVRESVQALGGEVHVARAAIGGAEFTVTLPLSKTPAGSSAEPVVTTPHVDQHLPHSSDDDVVVTSRGKDDDRARVLVIEDHGDLRRFIGECLQNDFHCTLIANGETGVQCAIEDVPDLVLSDVMLPGMDGFEVTRALRNDERTSHIPIVLLTAREDRESLFRGLSEKADEYLTKPFDAEELKLRLHNLIEVRQIMRRQAAAEWREAQANTEMPAAAADLYGPKDQAFLNKLNGVLTNRFADNAFGVREMASAMAMSDRQLQRKLLALLDARPADHLRDFRLQQAASMLAKGKPVGVVAQDCGFATQAHFGQCFKARFGVTPGEYGDGARSAIAVIRIKSAT